MRIIFWRMKSLSEKAGTFEYDEQIAGAYSLVCIFLLQNFK